MKKEKMFKKIVSFTGLIIFAVIVLGSCGKGNVNENSELKYFSNEWKDVQFKSTDGTVVTISFEKYCNTEPDLRANHGSYSQIIGCSVNPTWIKVDGRNLKGTEAIRAVFLPDAAGTQTIQKDLKFYSETHAAIAIDDSLNIDTHVWRSSYPASDDNPSPLYKSVDSMIRLSDVQAVAIVIDGVWLKNPVSGYSNFEFRMK